MGYLWGKGGVFIGFWLGGLKGRDCWEDQGIGGHQGDKD
jgi:hypothetical protein